MAHMVAPKKAKTLKLSSKLITGISVSKPLICPEVSILLSVLCLLKTTIFLVLQKCRQVGEKMVVWKPSKPRLLPPVPMPFIQPVGISIIAVLPVLFVPLKVVRSIPVPKPPTPVFGETLSTPPRVRLLSAILPMTFFPPCMLLLPEVLYTLIPLPVIQLP